jgi:hypothetical protein
MTLKQLYLLPVIILGLIAYGLVCLVAWIIGDEYGRSPD